MVRMKMWTAGNTFWHKRMYYEYICLFPYQYFFC